MPAVSGSPTQLAASVTTLANLGGLPDDAYKDGDFAYVQSTRATYQLDRTSNATPSSVAVDTFSGNGQWVFFQASTSWGAQATWYIDPATGDDENDGATTTTALATWAEFTRRVQTVTVPSTTVKILSTTTESIVGRFLKGATDASLIVEGVPTVVATADATAFVDPQITSITNIRGTVTCGDLVFDVSHVGSLLRVAADPTTAVTLTRGPYFAPVLDVVAGVAQVPFWARWSLMNAKPADARRLEVLSLPEVFTVQLESDGLPMQVRYLSLRPAYAAYQFTTNSVAFVSRGAISGQVALAQGVSESQVHGAFFACIFNAAYVSTSVPTYFVGCLFNAPASDTSFYGSHAIIIGGGAIGGIYLPSASGASFQGTIIQSGSLTIAANAYTSNSFVTLASATNGLGVFGATGDGVKLYGPGILSGNGILYGGGATSRNTGRGLSVTNGGRVVLTTNPTITGTQGDLYLNSAATAVPPPSALGVWSAAADLTGVDGVGWTKWAAAPFNRRAVAYDNLSSIAGS